MGGWVGGWQHLTSDDPGVDRLFDGLSHLFFVPVVAGAVQVTVALVGGCGG